jgi:hypothetical protein
MEQGVDADEAWVGEGWMEQGVDADEAAMAWRCFRRKLRNVTTAIPARVLLWQVGGGGGGECRKIFDVAFYL